MGNKVSLEENLIDLKIVSKQMVRSSKKCEQKEKAAIGRTVLKMDNLKKYYEVAANALFGGGEKKVVKANETLSFEAHESETLAIVGESGCGKSTFAKVLMGLETATDGQILLDNRISNKCPSKSATPRLWAKCRWCSRTLSTR